MSSSSVLITGISGFVGPYLARQLLDSGHEEVGFLQRRASHIKPDRLAETGNLAIVEGDITDLTSLLSAVHKTQPNWIFHLAAHRLLQKALGIPWGHLESTVWEQTTS